eukprot:TRINITY_DN8071_c0_g4_i5.p1 TRINITY_DN8071_c0_g4~~TRINITY_DN8071_c0_g4_i5.p1  ORF type:complete len:182 (-),score=54.04 TRINITY_DN8071_c0_g4_i5:92-637(-)
MCIRDRYQRRVHGVGKSSVINSLKRSKAASVSSVPGHTKAMQEIYIDSKVKVLDSPGVVFSDEDEKIKVLRNTIKVEEVQDPVGVIEEILKRVNKIDMCTLYRIADYDSVTEFLCSIARVRNKVKKGGALDLETSAKIVLHDWVDGRIKFFTVPPELIPGEINTTVTERPVGMEEERMGNN